MSSEPEAEPADDQPIASPELLPLDAWHRARGGRMVPFAGYAMPVQYEGIVAEHLWTRDHAGLFDVSHMGQILLTGTVDCDPAAALEALLPGDVRNLAPGRMRYSMLLDDQGGVIDDLMVARLTPINPFTPSEVTGRAASDAGAAEDLYMVVNGATKWEDLGWMREHLPDDVTINLMEHRALLALQGPEAAVALARLVPGAADLFFMQAGNFDWDGYDLWISRSGYTGEDGFEISIVAEGAEALAQALAGMDEVRPVGLGARDSLRLEAGLPLYGHDLTLETGPVGAGLSFALSKPRRETGGYIGHAAVVRDFAQGSTRRWVGLAIEGRQPAREGAEVLAGDTSIGRVSSGGFSPSLGRPIAMAWIDAAQAAPGTALEVEVRGKRLSATVVATPFVPHRYHRQGAKK